MTNFINKLLIVFFLSVFYSNAGATVKLILDTDLAWDHDDAGAIATLHGLANLGEVEILGIGISADGDDTSTYTPGSVSGAQPYSSGIWSPRCLDIINTYYNRPNIPIGLVRPRTNQEAANGRNTPTKARYCRKLVEDYGYSYDLDANSTWDAVALYRKLLSEQPDHSVVMLSIGYLSNFSDLLKSTPDQYSNLSGIDLVSKKVSKWVLMGGDFTGADESNLYHDQNSAEYAVHNWPTPILFDGLEVGTFPVGGNLLQNTPENNPVRRIYELMNPTWYTSGALDPTAILAAVRGTSNYWQLSASGSVTVYGNGNTSFSTSQDKGHRYIIGHSNDTAIQAEINGLMTLAPIQAGPPVANFSSNSTFVTKGSNVNFSDTSSHIPTTWNWSFPGGNPATSTSQNPIVSYSTAGVYDVSLTASNDNGSNSKTIAGMITVTEPSNLDPRLVALWNFDEESGNNAVDATGHGNDGTLSGTSTWVAGKNGSALHFSDATNQMKTSVSTVFSLPEFSISMWVKWPDGLASGWHAFLEYHRGSWDDKWYGIMTEGSNLSFVQHGEITPISPNTTDWYHLAVTLDANGVGKTYLNGVKIAEKAGSPMVIDSAFLTLGSNNGDGGGTPYESANAIVDEVGFYNVALSPADIQNIMAPAITHTLQTTASTGGDVSLGGVYDKGSVVNVNATPEVGYVFSGWSGDLSGSTNPTTITLNADKSIIANFSVVNNQPTFTSPTPGSTLSAVNQLFSWNPNGESIETWAFYVGSTLGGKDYYVGGNTPTNSKLVTGLPSDGSIVYVRLWYKTAGVWKKIDSTYTASNVPGPFITSPTSGSTLTGTSQTFSWNPNGSGGTVESWVFYIGSSVGAKDYYVGGNSPTSNSKVVTGLPNDGSTVYARLWYKVQGSWAKIDASYTAGNTTIQVPVAGFSQSTTSIDAGQSINFSDTSTHNPTTWSWSFEGGTPTSSNEQNPTVTYNTAGIYNASLTVSNSAGSDSHSKTALITVLPNVDSRLVALWNFDEGSGSNAVDATGHGNDGTLSGTSIWVAGKNGSALHFSDATNQMKTSVSTVFSLPEFSISMWVKWPDGLASGWHAFLEYHRGSWDDKWYGIMTEGSNLSFVQHGEITPISPNTTDWYHLAVTLDANGVGKTYLNGIKIAEKTGSPMVIDSAFLTLGSNNGDGGSTPYESANAIIDEVGFYNVALTQAEIQQMIGGSSESPVVSLNGNNPQHVDLNSNYSDPGATATDAKDGALTVTTSGTVDTSQAGSYTISYSATDSDSNTTTETRIVIVSDTNNPVKVILDTDVAYDWDDAGAVATLHALANNGKAEILGMMVSADGEGGIYGPRCLDIINTYYNRPNIPIGVVNNGHSDEARYCKQLVEDGSYPYDLDTASTRDAVELYRELLLKQKDHSVVIVSVGFLTNLRDLLLSGVDGVTSGNNMSGVELVRKKVKQWVVMGGAYPPSAPQPATFNFGGDNEAAKYAINNWPTPILFDGWFIGDDIYTGSSLVNTPDTNPVKQIYEIMGGINKSWDQTAIIAAILGPDPYWEVSDTGCNTIVGNLGSNIWDPNGSCDHRYLIDNDETNDQVTELMNQLMAQPPVPASSKVKVIYDTDLAYDWDDAGATATLHGLANLGEVEILGMGISSSHIWSPPCLDAINTYYNRPDIPIGIASGADTGGSVYCQQIVESGFSQDLGIAGAVDAVELYRQLLSSQPDNSVVMIVIGYLGNMSLLLQSEGDSYSSLNGLDLVNQKVKKMVIMAGEFDADFAQEGNVLANPSATQYVMQNWPTPILFSGLEIGDFHTGSSLVNTPNTNPVKKIYEIMRDAGPYGLLTHVSFDQTAVLAAIRNPTDYWDISESGDVRVRTDGGFWLKWYPTPDRQRRYLIRREDNSNVYTTIESLMGMLPNNNTDLPISNFSASNTSINTGGSVNFIDSSSNSPSTWSWEFPGGTPTSSNLQNPTVTYNSVGNYEVQLTVSNASGNDVEIKTAYITVSNVITGGSHYYISNTGSDNNDGSSISPWRTVNHALSQIQSGTINIAAGTYDESILIEKLATASEPLIIKGEQGVIFSGSNNSNADLGIITIRNSSHITLDGIAIENAKTHAISIKGNNDYITVQNCSTDHTRGSAVRVSGGLSSRRAYPASPLRWQWDETWHMSNITITHNNFRRSQEGRWDGNNIWDEDITVGHGVDGFEVSYNHVNDYNHQLGHPYDGGPIGIDVKDGIKNGTIHHNLVENIPSSGIYIDAYGSEARNIQIYQNIVRNVLGNGIDVGAEHGGLLDSHKVYNNLVDTAGQSGIAVANNAPPTNGIVEPIQPKTNIDIYNNTVYKGGDSDWGWGIYIGDRHNGKIYNNIIADSKPFNFRIDRPAESNVSHNCINNTYNNDAVSDNNEPVYPYTVNTIVQQNLLFIDDSSNIDNRNFNLQTSSPCKDAGTSNGAPTDDLEEKTRVGTGAIDIGAYEVL